MLSNISGFPEFLPQEQLAFNHLVDIIKNRFELYGFSPLDTPAVEKISTLLAKGNDNEIYGIYRLAGKEEDNKKDLALRFDLTVPLARYVAQHYGLLTFPYRRYHIAPVWRGERPQAGRYRQFYQCDIDIIGDGELALDYDCEILSIIHEIFKSLNIKNFIIKINNRNILSGLIKSFGVSEENVPDIMRVIDKAEKITEDKLVMELSRQNLSQVGIKILMELIHLRTSNEKWLEYLKNLSDFEEFQAGLHDLGQVLQNAYSFGVQDKYIQITPGLARGLSYYTGIVYETILTDYPELGSVCGGGRYANLVSNFTGKKLPGVGISIGISRLAPKLIETGQLQVNAQTPAQLLITTQNHAFMAHYVKIAQTVRNLGIKTELYLAQKPLTVQMKYAAKKGFRFVIIADETELEKEIVIIRNMITGIQTVISLHELHSRYFEI